jgi:hypothetical protein
MRARMPSTPPTDASPSPREPWNLRHSWGQLPGFARELIIFGAALLVGVIGMPLLIWVAGNRVLGPYTQGANLHAGPWALLQDFFVALSHGSVVFWLVALGPAVFVLLLRLFVALLRAGPRARRD